MNDQRFRIAFAIVAVVSLVLAASPAPIQQRLKGWIVACVGPVQSSAEHIRAGLLTIARLPAKLFSGTDDSELRRAREEIQRLRELLVIETSKANQYRKQIEGLVDFNDFAGRNLTEKIGVIPARVIGRDATGRPGVIVIDRGTRDGVRAGAGVVWGHSAVGVVKLARSRSSLVDLITNPDCHVPAYIQRTGESTMVSGTTDGNLRMHHVFRRPVVAGDWCLTSGDLGIFPRDIVIGRVVGQPHVPPGKLFWEIVIQPQDLLSLQTVIVLVLEEREP